MCARRKKCSERFQGFLNMKKTRKFKYVYFCNIFHVVVLVPTRVRAKQQILTNTDQRLRRCFAYFFCLAFISPSCSCTGFCVIPRMYFTRPARRPSAANLSRQQQQNYICRRSTSCAQGKRRKENTSERRIS